MKFIFLPPSKAMSLTFKNMFLDPARSLADIENSFVNLKRLPVHFVFSQEVLRRNKTNQKFKPSYATHCVETSRVRKAADGKAAIPITDGSNHQPDEERSHDWLMLEALASK